MVILVKLLYIKICLMSKYDIQLNELKLTSNVKSQMIIRVQNSKKDA